MDKLSHSFDLGISLVVPFVKTNLKRDICINEQLLD